MRHISYEIDPVKYHRYATRRAEWIAALLSGDYKQGVGRLISPSLDEKQENKYCCLGVACEVLGERLGYKLSGDCSYYKNDETTVAASLVLPEVLRKYLGLKESDQKVLTALNDRRVPFDTIAVVIEALDIYEED